MAEIVNSYDDFAKYLKPKETCWEKRYFDGELKFIIITKNQSRERYYLYKIEDGKRIEISKAQNPLYFEKYIKKR